MSKSLTGSLLSMPFLSMMFLDMDNDCKYALVIQDFHTQEINSICSAVVVPMSTRIYFAALPIGRRAAVKYLISDMYNQYITYVDKYFPNTSPVVRLFPRHSMDHPKVDNYIRQLLKVYRQRDKNSKKNSPGNNKNSVISCFLMKCTFCKNTAG